MEYAVFPNGYNSHIVSGYLDGQPHLNCARWLSRVIDVRIVEEPELPMCALCAEIERRKDALSSKEGEGQLRRDGPPRGVEGGPHP